ncbi:hypothetical protein OPT61_g6382 [Boeremia exigua]|uniref:Uncharacterized protein n=1 Tax=Boeremia exigua TaxID=749465 RepID=A0ACC2I6U1_9PLEO|nr:hypothetical protein OPT61_g6382 [Boeremia exigua]
MSTSATRVANTTAACERCHKLTLLLDTNTTYHEHGQLHDLAAPRCHICALILGIRRSYAHEDGLEPLPEETVVFVEHMPPVPVGKPRAFELLFYDNVRGRTLEFRFLTVGVLEGAVDGSAPKLEQTSNTLLTRSSRKDEAALPTRLLEVTDGQVRLVSTEDLPLSLEYMSLSHMWGAHPEDQLQLVVSRLEEFKSGVPVHEMSKIFIEAANITRHLNCRYLWVDSLCIIQDSAQDWEKEASRMSEVYSNAVCNLAFLYPPGDESDCLSTSDTHRPCTFRAITSEKTVAIKPLFPEHRNLPCGTAYWDWLIPSKWPLFGRAWAFQEHLLAQRTILYGRGNIMWQCYMHCYDESLGLLTRGKAHEPISKSRIPTSEIDRATLWLEILQDYRSRQLTRHEDRAMALAGTARVFAQIHKCTYLAGHLAEDMPDSLLWQINSLISTSTVREPALRPAPSWSCFSVPLQSPDKIKFTETSKSTRDFNFKARLSSYGWHGYPLNYLPHWSFYRFAGLCLTFEAVALRGVVTNSKTAVAGVKLSKGSPMDDDIYLESYTPDMRDSSTNPNHAAVLGKEQRIQIESALHNVFGQKANSCYTNGPVINPRTDSDVTTASVVDDEELGLEQVLLAVLYIYTRSDDIWLEGLALTPGKQFGTWERVGHWICTWTRSREDYKTDSDAIERLRASNTRLIELV